MGNGKQEVPLEKLLKGFTSPHSKVFPSSPPRHLLLALLPPRAPSGCRLPFRDISFCFFPKVSFLFISIRCYLLGKVKEPEKCSPEV